MAHSVVRVEGGVKIEPTRELEAMLRRVMLDVMRSQQHTETIPAVRPDETVVFSTTEVAASMELVRLKSELRAITGDMDLVRAHPGGYLARLQERLTRLAR